MTSMIDTNGSYVFGSFLDSGYLTRGSQGVGYNTCVIESKLDTGCSSRGSQRNDRMCVIVSSPDIG